MIVSTVAYVIAVWPHGVGVNTRSLSSKMTKIVACPSHDGVDEDTRGAERSARVASGNSPAVKAVHRTWRLIHIVFGRCLRREPKTVPRVVDVQKAHQIACFRRIPRATRDEGRARGSELVSGTTAMPWRENRTLMDLTFLSTRHEF